MWPHSVKAGEMSPAVLIQNGGDQIELIPLNGGEDG